MIAVHLPNTVEFMLTVLAAHRAGLIVALLPQLWRQAELTVALNRTGARAIVTMSSIDGVNHADLAMNAAAEAFSIRHVCGFGDDLPEGMASLDHVLAHPSDTTRAFIQDGRKAAVISFDVTADGFRAVPRTHLNLIAGGLAIFLESKVPQGARMMSAFAPSSFAGLTSSLLVWLLAAARWRCTIHSTTTFSSSRSTMTIATRWSRRRNWRCGWPRTICRRVCRACAMSSACGVRRSRLPSSPTWTAANATLTDVYLFGEAGLFGARRGADGAPAPVMPGPYGAPRDVPASSTAGEILLTPKGTLGLRGPMVPIAAYAPPAPASDSLMSAHPPPRDYVDTGYAARLDRATGAISITAPPSGVMAVGGYRFLAQDLQEWARRLGQNAMLTALPDRLSGHRLAGRASDNARAREALTELGLNPLMVEAFRDRSAAA